MEKRFLKISNIAIVLLTIGFLSLIFVLPGKSYNIAASLQNLHQRTVTLNAFAAETAKSLAASVYNLLPLSKTDFAPAVQNLLILGVPGQPNNAPYLTDTIIVAQIQKNDNTASINTISIPRDLLVEKDETLQKINSLYVRGKTISLKKGIENIKTKIEEITGTKISNYLLIDTTAVKELVNQVNGINILVPKDIYDPNFPGLGDSFETFAIKKGWRYLDGDAALKYARTRHDSENDFGRMKRQLQVLRALKDKVFALNPLLNLPLFLKMLKTLNSHIETDLGPVQIVRLWNLSKQISKEKINHIILDTNPAKNILKGTIMNLGGQEAAVLLPIEGIENYSKIQWYIQKNVQN